MKIIFDNIIYSLQKSGGISVYWKKLEDSIFCNKRFVYKNRCENIFYEPHENEVEVDGALLFERYKNPRLKKIDLYEPFIFHSSYYRYCKNKNAVNITTVHDFTYELFRNDLKSKFHKLQKKRAVMYSDGVICISENTRKDLYKYYPKYKGNVQVIYHGYDNNLYNFEGLTFEKRNRIVIFVGSRVEYKGFYFAVKVLSKIPELTLKIIGGGNLSCFEKNFLNENIPNRFKKIGYVSNEDLSKIYNEAFALFYPSEYEGFGFPVIEAQACGCPVICQKKSSIPEVSGNKCIYADSNDIKKSIVEIKKLFDCNFFTKLQNEGLENVKRFSWDKCIKETKNFYKYLYESLECKKK